MPDIWSDLNEEQRRVVQATQGPVLVLAGAGSGKTRALTHRIAHLLEQGLARPDEILAVTFTNKAAGEMKERVARLTARHEVPRGIGTFHAIGARIVREYARYVHRSPGFTILDEQDSLRLLKAAAGRVGADKRQLAASLKAVISRAKNEGEKPAEEVGQAVFAEYQRLLAVHDACDFDDLLVLPVQLLQEHREIQQRLCQRWRFISVDEYQDTNVLQVKFLTLLLGPEKNLCVVGDDYQAIYSWRGAKVDHIRDFPKQFPGCAVLPLTQNYRSTPAVLETANALMANEREGRQLWTLRQAQGEPVQLFSASNDRDEAGWVREQVLQHVASGGKYADCAVLYRTNAQSRIFEEEFLRREIPYMIVGGYRFYERREVKDALALLQLAHNGQAGMAAARVAAALWPGVGPKTLTSWGERAQAAGRPLWEELVAQAEVRPVMAPAVRAITRSRQQRQATVADELRHLLAASGYLARLAREADGPERKENLEELMNVASVYQDAREFLEAVALFTDLDHGGEQVQDRVMCMTLHAAKGLEFPRVFIVGCEEGLLPHVNSVASREALEEERRLLYVGMTRAKDQLVLTHANRRLLYGSLTVSLPSRFLTGLPLTPVERYGASEGVDETPTETEELIDYTVVRRW